jgi:PBP1b-binding outer membrane lipoprotein LpoB
VGVTSTSSGGAPAKKALLVILACLAAFFVAGCSEGANEIAQNETKASTDTTREEETAEVSSDKPTQHHLRPR